MDAHECVPDMVISKNLHSQGYRVWEKDEHPPFNFNAESPDRCYLGSTFTEGDAWLLCQQHANEAPQPLLQDPHTFIAANGVLAFVGYFVMHRDKFGDIMSPDGREISGEEQEFELWLNNAAKLLPDWSRDVLNEK